jgi:Acetyltransferase (GNAT) domain
LEKGRILDAEIRGGNSGQTQTLSGNPSDRSALDSGASESSLSAYVLTTVKAVEEFRPSWGDCIHSVETDIDYYLHKVKSDPAILHPYVIVVTDGGAVRAMLVGTAKRVRVSTVTAFISIPGPKATVLEILREGHVGRQSPEIDRLLALQLCTALKRGEIDFLTFERMSWDSGLRRELQESLGLRLKKRLTYSHDSGLQLPTRGGTVGFSQKLKRELRRKGRILNSKFQKVNFKCLSEPIELVAGLRDAAAIATKTWKHSFGWGLVSSEQAQEDFNFFIARGLLRIYMLCLDELPAAFVIGPLYNRAFYYQYVGYQPEFEQFAVGWLLNEWLLKHLIDSGAEWVDFGGRGNLECNRRLGCKESSDADIHIYAPTIHGLCVNTFFSTTQVVQEFCREALLRLRLNRTRKAWMKFVMAIRTFFHLHAKPAPDKPETAAIPLDLRQEDPSET